MSERMSEPQGQVLGQQADVERGVLLGGEGVEVAPHLVDRFGDGRRGALGGALEQQVLEEVRRTGLLGLLVTRAGAHPEADAHRAGVVHPLGGQGQARRQNLGADHRRRRLVPAETGRLAG